MKLPKSYDLVGNILISNEKITKESALELLKRHKNIKTVAYKEKNYSGKYRTPKLKIVAGLKNKETIHVESGIKIKLNPEKCYFSPRTSNERLRISKLIKKDETVLVMFSGVAPFPLVLSKNSKAKEIYGIEYNPSAHKYALENLTLNKIKNVRLIKGNVKTVLPKINKKFDRIIMPHPSNSESYLNLALKHLKEKGTIHLYLFSHENDFKELLKKYKLKFKKVKLIKSGSPSPGKYRTCLDLN